MGKVRKDQRLNIRISGVLKERFVQTLEIEGYDASDYIIGKIVELVERVEEKQNVKATIALLEAKLKEKDGR